MSEVDARFDAFFRHRIGMDIGSVGPKVVAMAIERRQRWQRLPSIDAYWALLEQDDAECQALIESVVVSESWFYRYAESFAALRRVALERRGGAPLRLLSLPCASGEEPYSIVMTLFDAGLGPAEFSVDAVDVSDRALSRAREARYGPHAFRDSAVKAHQHHFLFTEEGAQVTERVRRQVRLFQGNLLESSRSQVLGIYDVVFCRNLLIYLDAQARSRALAVLTELSAPGGLVFVAPSEACLLLRSGFRAAPLPQSSAFFVSSTQPAGPPPSSPGVRRDRPQSKVRRASERHASAPLTKRCLQPKAPSLEHELARVERLANARCFDEALTLCRQLQTRLGPDASIYYWQGLIHDARGDASRAVDDYRKALYLCPDHVEALMQLAALSEARGDDAQASRLRYRLQLKSSTQG